MDLRTVFLTVWTVGKFPGPQASGGQSLKANDMIKFEEKQTECEIKYQLTINLRGYMHSKLKKLVNIFEVTSS